VDKHLFKGPANGPCRHGDSHGDSCGYLAANEIHQNVGPAILIEDVAAHANPSGARALAAGRTKRPTWAELPIPSKAIIFLGGAGATALFVCLVVAACAALLRVAF